MAGLHKMHMNNININTKTTITAIIFFLAISAIFYYLFYYTKNTLELTAWYQAATTLLSSTLTLVAAITIINAHITKKEIDDYLKEAKKNIHKNKKIQ